MPRAVKVASKSEMFPGARRIVEVDGVPIAVFRIDDAYCAIEDVCTHDGGPLADGSLEGSVIVCPRHGARFDVCTGKALCLPAVDPVPTYPTEVRDDDVYVIVED